MPRNNKEADRLAAIFAEQEKAANLASTATGFIMSICFFFLPLVWSNMFHVMSIPAPVNQYQGPDPWSEFKDL